MKTVRQHIEASDRRLIADLVRRVNEARNFPTNTDPSSRHVEIMGETLGDGQPYPMLDEERGHCATSLLATVAALYETRTLVAELLSIARRWAALDAGAWHPVRWEADRVRLLADTRAAIARALGEPQP